jgi:phosphoribosylformylglycinamidine (FGAM) synthase-like enzyme
VRKIKLGDSSMSVLEIWGAEYQENDCLLIKAEDESLLQRICDRERTFMQVGLILLFSHGQLKIIQTRLNIIGL